MTEVDDWTWWTSIGGDLADQVPDEVWDAALDVAFDPSTQAMTDDLIPTDDVLADASDLAFADNTWSDDAGADSFAADDADDDFDSDDDGGDDDGDDGFVGL